MYFTLLSTYPQSSRFLLHSTTRPNSNPLVFLDPNDISFLSQSRNLSDFGSLSYDRSLRRAFTRLKLLTFFNPDLDQFITFTYKTNQQDVEQLLYDFKKFIKKVKYNKYQLNNNSTKNKNLHNKNNSTLTPPLANADDEFSTFPRPAEISPAISCDCFTDPKKFKIRSRSGGGNVVNSLLPQPKYVFVIEKQRRGALHIHMLANKFLNYSINKNGYLHIPEWKHGFSSVKQLGDFDENFKTYLYLFKYMNKAQRIGKSFIHTSRNFDKIVHLDYDEFITSLDERDLIYKELNEFTYNGQKHTINKKYFDTQAYKTGKANDNEVN